MAETQELRSFHETIVEAIRDAHTIEDMVEILLTTTDVPGNHNAIIAAIQKRWEGYSDLIERLVRGLHVQKQAAEARATAGEKEPDLDALESVVISLWSLYTLGTYDGDIRGSAAWLEAAKEPIAALRSILSAGENKDVFAKIGQRIASVRKAMGEDKADALFAEALGEGLYEHLRG